MQVDDGELALLDVREVTRHGKGHPFLAANVPLSQLETQIRQRVPRRTTRIVLCDDDGSLSHEACLRLRMLGYKTVHILSGGTAAWQKTGYTLFPETDVPSKGFGAFASLHGKPRFITPNAVHEYSSTHPSQWLVMDARPFSEYQRGCIPGSINAPAGEALRCFDDLVSSPDVNVVINCMSATRGILGGLSLEAAGVANPVHVLLHGTRGWTLAGHELESDSARVVHPPGDLTQRSAMTRATRLLVRLDIPLVTLTTVNEWQRQAERTTYLVDVRSAKEFAAGHLSGAINAPDGAVVMSPQTYMATLNARVVLVDDDTVRATVAAMWLKQMGLFDVAVLKHGIAAGPLTVTDSTAPIARDAQFIGLERLIEMRKRGEVRILDLSASADYERAHIPGARWCSRATINGFVNNVTFADATVLTSTDGVIASYAGAELGHAVFVLRGGNNAWSDSGQTLTDERAEFVDARDDLWLASGERPGDPHKNMLNYLDWEEQLLDNVETSGEMPYRNLIW